MEEQSVSASVGNTDDDEISFVELAISLGEEKKSLFAVLFSTTTMAVLLSLLMTPIFTAKTVLMLPQQQGNSASVFANLGSLAGLATGAMSIKSPDEMYVAFMQSEGVQHAVIKRLNLLDRYELKSLSDAQQTLNGVIRITPDKKTGLITVEADDKDPLFAAQLANVQVQELQNLLGRLAVTEAQQRRMFYEQQIKKTQEELAISEASLREANQKSGMQITSLLAESGVRTSAELRAQIATRELQLQAMSRFATDQNPEIQRISSELVAMRARLTTQEQGSGGTVKISASQQQAVKSYRDVKIQEAMLDVFIKQYEMARVDEAKEGPQIQQVYIATAPERKSKPKRALIVLVGVVVGLIIGVGTAITRSFIRKVKTTKTGSAQIDLIKKAWSLK